jgi:hypothetical protein
MQSEMGEHNVIPSNTNRSGGQQTGGSNSKIQAPPRDRKKEGNALAKMATLFKDTLVVLYNHFEVEIPPVENLEDPRWNGFIGRVMKKMVDYQGLAENAKDAADNYKIMLNEKCFELVTITEKYRVMVEQIDRGRS